MPDAFIDDAQRDRMFNRLGTIAGYHRDFLQLEQFFHPKNTDKYLVRMIEGDELKAVILDIRITRAVLRTDTDSEAIVFARLIDGGAGTGHNVQFFIDQARLTKIADLDAVVNDNQTGEISPDTSANFLAGQIDIGVTTGLNIDFSFYIAPAPADRALVEFNGNELEDADIRNDLETIFRELHSAFRTQRRRVERIAFALVLGTSLRGGLFKRVVSFSDDSVLFSPGLSANASGGIVSEPSGFGETLRRAMLDNTAGSGEIKVGAIVATPTVSFTGTVNPGRSAGIALDDRAVAGEILLTCSKGLDARAPRFRALFTPTDARKDLGVNFDQERLEFELTLGFTWRSVLAGIASFLLEYAPIITNEVGTPLSTVSTDWNQAGLSTANSTSGVIFAFFDGTDLKFYRTEAGRDADDAADVVATVAAPAINTVFTVTGDAGLTVTGKTGAALVSGDKGKVNYNPPVPTTPADFVRITIAVTTEPGELQRLIGRGLIGGSPFILNSGAAPNVTDAQVVAGTLLAGFKFFGDSP